MSSLPRAPGFRLDGRRALVTGAGRGIGVAIAAALAQAGAAVTLVARSSCEIEANRDAIRAQGGIAHASTLDVTDVAAVRAFVAASDGYDILVNNAGTNRPKPLAEVSEEDFDVVAGLNIRAAYFVAQAVAGRMVADRCAGSLIHIGSQMGHVGAANRTLYCTTKWALEGLSKALAVELGPHAIRSNVIAPTFIATPLTQPFLADPAFRIEVESKIKLGRIGRPEDIMGAVVYLASDAAALVTGTSLLVDGGWTAE